MTQLANEQTVTTEVLTAQALELRMAGATYQQIAKSLGIGLSTAHRYVISGIEDTREKSGVLAEIVRNTDLARCDALLLALWPKRSQPRTADTILRVLERRAKLTGADAPTRFEGSGPGGGSIPVSHSFDLTVVSSETLREIEDMLRGAGAAPVGNQDPEQLPGSVDVSGNGGGEQNGLLLLAGDETRP